MWKVWFLAPLLILAACASAERQPEKTWDVKVSTRGAEARLWVFKADNSKQCGAEGAPVLAPEVAAKGLKSEGIMVYQFRNGHDGMMRPAVCGAPTGRTVELEISPSDLPKAQALGYRIPRVTKR